MKGKHGLLEEGLYKTATSMVYIFSSKHFTKIAIYQRDCVLGKQKYSDSLEIIVHYLKPNANTIFVGLLYQSK